MKSTCLIHIETKLKEGQLWFFQDVGQHNRQNLNVVYLCYAFIYKGEWEGPVILR